MEVLSHRKSDPSLAGNHVTTGERLDPRAFLDRATTKADKARYFDAEVYFREVLTDCAHVWPSSPLMKFEGLTTMILKPEAVVGRMLTTVLSFLRRNGFRIVAAELIPIDRLMVRELWRYRFNIATPERLMVMDLLMSATQSLFLVLDGPTGGADTAAVHLRSLKGPASPGRREPHQLRYQLGNRSHLINYVHAPDEVADVIRELGILFGHADRRRLLRQAAEGIDRGPVAEMLARTLSDRHDEHDLSYVEALHRITGAVRSLNPSHAAVSLLTAIREEQCRDWQTLFESLDSLGVAVAEWDRIVILAELIEMSLPGRTPLLA